MENDGRKSKDEKVVIGELKKEYARLKQKMRQLPHSLRGIQGWINGRKEMISRTLGDRFQNQDGIGQT